MLNRLRAGLVIWRTSAHATCCSHGYGIRLPTGRRRSGLSARGLSREDHDQTTRYLRYAHARADDRTPRRGARVPGRRSVRARTRRDQPAVRGRAVCVGSRAVGGGQEHVAASARRVGLPDSGSITFDGDEIGHLSDEQQSEFRHHRVGFVFQFFNLLPTLSAWENVAVPKLLDGVRLGKVKSDAVRLLDRVGLGNRTQHRPAELSGGQMQRVAVARALMMDPSLILADEPTGNLDSTTGASILALLAEVAHEDGDRRLVVMVTHNSGCRGGDRSGDHPPGRSGRFRRVVGGPGMRPGSAIAAAASRLRVFSLRELVVHRRRTTASIAVMAVSAMYLVAVFGIFGSITGSVNRLADGIAGIAALEVSGITDAGFPDTITADVAAVPGVATAAPMIRTSASTASGPVLLFGADASSAALGGALKDAVAKPIEDAVREPQRCPGRAAVSVRRKARHSSWARLRSRSPKCSPASSLPISTADTTSLLHLLWRRTLPGEKVSSTRY